MITPFPLAVCDRNMTGYGSRVGTCAFQEPMFSHHKARNKSERRKEHTNKTQPTMSGQYINLWRLFRQKFGIYLIVWKRDKTIVFFVCLIIDKNNLFYIKVLKINCYLLHIVFVYFVIKQNQNTHPFMYL